MEKYNLDPNGSTNKPMPQIDNYHRDDSGLGPNGRNQGSAQENIRQDVNGSTDKPFPQERNWVFNSNPEDSIEGGYSMPSKTKPDVSIGQVKYARREGVESIYSDETRNTADDFAASRKAKSSTIYEVEDDEENQGSSGL